MRGRCSSPSDFLDCAPVQALLGRVFFRPFLLLQLRVLGLGLLQDGDVGVGVFPEGEEILVCSFRFGASPEIAYARASPRCASAPIGSFVTTPG